MTWLRVHPERYAARDRLAGLDPDRDAAEVYRELVFRELPWEMQLGLNLAFYRTFAAPRIAAVLGATGEMEGRPAKRANDTGLLVYELVEHGFDHPRGRHVVRALRRLHDRPDVRDDDQRYVLGALVVVPTRFVDRHGWRALTPVERAASAAFHGELGRRLGVPDLPPSYDGWARLLDDYERAELVPTDAARRLLAATQDVMADRLPRALRPLGPLLTAALLDERVARAVGLEPAGRPVRALVRAALALRGAVVRRLPPRRSSWFTPGAPVPGVYPDGYTLADLGPAGRD